MMAALRGMLLLQLGIRVSPRTVNKYRPGVREVGRE